MIEFNLEIEGETVSEESSNEMSESETETSVVACWWVGRHDSGRRCRWGHATKRKQSGHQKDKKVHIEKKFVPGKNIVIDESTVEFKHKIIFEIYNPKDQ
jgi:hypothetical protein